MTFLTMDDAMELGRKPGGEDKYGPFFAYTEDDFKRDKAVAELQTRAGQREHSRFELGVADALGNAAHERALERGDDPSFAYLMTVNEYLAGDVGCECQGDGTCAVCRAAARQLSGMETEGDELPF